MLIGQSNYKYACCADAWMACGGDFATSIYQPTGPTWAQSTNLAVGGGNPADNGNNNNQTSNSIALGIGTCFGIPSVFLTAAVVIMKYLKRRNDRDHGDSRSSSSMAPLTNIVHSNLILSSLGPDTRESIQIASIDHQYC